MSLTRYTPDPLEVAVADHTASGLKQKARFIRLEITDDYVRLYLIVFFFTASNERLGGKGFAPYEVILTADNNTVVNTNDGSILLEKGTLTNEEFLIQAEELNDAMFEAEFFKMLRDTQQVNIASMIATRIQTANTSGKFNQ